MKKTFNEIYAMKVSYTQLTLEGFGGSTGLAVSGFGGLGGGQGLSVVDVTTGKGDDASILDGGIDDDADDILSSSPSGRSSTLSPSS